MKGTITVAVNNATLIEAMQDYFDKQLAEGKRMTVSEVSQDTSAYGSMLQVTVKLAEKEVAQVHGELKGE